jgi:hypothetical protein
MNHLYKMAADTLKGKERFRIFHFTTANLRGVFRTSHCRITGSAQIVSLLSAARKKMQEICGVTLI